MKEKKERTVIPPGASSRPGLLVIQIKSTNASGSAGAVATAGAGICTSAEEEEEVGKVAGG